MKKLAVLTILLSMAGPSIWAQGPDLKDQSYDGLFVTLGRHCFNREFNERLYKRLINRGEKPEDAEAVATGTYVNFTEFCKRYRALIETMGGDISK